MEVPGKGSGALALGGHRLGPKIDLPHVSWGNLPSEPPGAVVKVK